MEKEEIRNKPFLVFKVARIYYYGPKISRELYIKIEVINHPKNIGLFSAGIYESHAQEKLFQYDEDGREFFNRLMPNFGKIIVQFDNAETKDFDNKYAGSLAGIESVIEFYTKNRNVMSKDKHVEKYIKMKGKGTLEDYIRENV